MSALVLRRFRPEPALLLRRFGPDGRLAALADRVPLAPLPVLVGPPGASGVVLPFNAVTAVNVTKGRALALNRATGQFLLAEPGYKPDAFVIGLAGADTLAGHAVDAEVGLFTLPDWTAIAGTVGLTPGAPYFLGSAGGITISPPAAPNCSTVVGTAVSTTTLAVDPLPPIQL